MVPPLITIGLTAYNAEQTIARALASAQAQDWPNLEILVVDDCSTDQSAAVVEQLARNDTRIRLVKHAENQGCAVARNSLIENAHGEFIAFLDDDDESMPDRLRLQFERIVEYERQINTDLIFCYVNRLVQIAGDAQTVLGHSIGYDGIPPRGQEVLDYLFWHIATPARSWGSMGSGTMMARKKVFQAVGPFDPLFRRSAEWDMAARLALLNGGFISVNKPLIIQHITRTTDKAGKAPLFYALQLRKKYKDFLKARHGYLGALACAYSRFYYARDMLWYSRFWLAIACLTAPHICMKEQLRRKLFSRL